MGAVDVELRMVRHGTSSPLLRRRPSRAVLIANHPERSNIEPPVQKCRRIGNETAENRILPVSVEMFLRLIALVEEPQSGICCGAVQIIDQHSGVRTGCQNQRLKPTCKLFFLSSSAG